MKSAPLLLAIFLISALLPNESFAQGLFKKLINRPDKDRILSGDEIINQEGMGSATFRKAEGFEKTGKLRKARDLYASVAKSYPNTKVGAESQFRVAQIRDQEGDERRAYDEYRTLITKYRSSTQFQKAIERQFEIAENLNQSGRKGIFGIGATIQPNDLKKMYEEIAEAAPFTHYAPRSLMAIGAINATDGLKPEAIRNYQSVVDNYRGTPFAKDSQFQIYQLRGEAAKASNSPSEDKAHVDAALDFLAQNPTDVRADEIKAGLEEIEERSLEKMFKTGQFYEKSDNHKAALIYYREIVKKPNSKYFGQASQRIEVIKRILAGEEIVETANRFGPLPKLNLPKPKLPRLRIGQKDEVLPIPADEAILPLPTPSVDQ